ncbi:hypothetical protein MLD38_005817 [Melastoma candidum]|uniref:Uncharacterized protein n=1 Tax=Melastoma candidum TaxID=119954 RepID=A0ACB9RNX7_9MYRT|nr:hypothetical protein MLD38_005817 [Melastoma candidum]
MLAVDERSSGRGKKKKKWLEHGPRVGFLWIRTNDWVYCGCSAFVQEFRNWDSAWALGAIYVVAYEIRVLAERADTKLSSEGKSPEKLKAAGSFLMKVFGVLAGKGPKRVGALYVTCQLFKIYFKLGTVHLCRSVIRSIETAQILILKNFLIETKLIVRLFFENWHVTYMYYTGRLEVFNEKFPAADHKLTYALKHCNPRNEANISFQLSRNYFLFYLLIYTYLVFQSEQYDSEISNTSKALGILPRDWLLEKYNLVEYREVIQSLQRGDLRLLRNALEENEDRFLRSGVYLVLEKLELQVYQRLLKKICFVHCPLEQLHIQKLREPGRAHQLKLEVIIKALRWLEIDMDLDEVECIVAILIHRNLVKGYFAHKSKFVVLSKQDPFPRLTGKPVDSSQQ